VFENFYHAFVLHGLEYFKKYYGVYRGTVSDNKDPENRGRIQAHVPAVGQQFAVNVWIDPAFPGAGLDRGMFWPPHVGDSVRVCFDQGDPSKPCTYWGGWFGAEDLPSEFDSGKGETPVKRGFITRGGHSIVFDDTEGSQSLKITWRKLSEGDELKTPARSDEGDTVAQLSFVDGGIELVFKDNQKIQIQDGVIKIDATKVEIATGADQKAVRGDELVQWLQAHNHGTAWGPSSPPLSPPPPTVLSSVTKLK
jgi:uncharacterized protein involved in type VI secretion and phage assembly